ncbi:hypothetical protein [Thiohalomonas denitrificans]|uniref:Uncharacterized protein n=1 Tax=Thiohalomonas denitrificans TaxID=415747 RepID=A0A1G5Q6M5_9GAMM|nr:hypothetical protein [Thiohalomonas denitrificans]SCZ57268.1 hypothetical protein SAMN03097708_01395 [Thiohalomonas denitrificans]
MLFSLKHSLLVASVSAGVLLTACANGGQTKESTAIAAVNNDDYFEAYDEGRLYVFDDADTYLAFLEHGETPFRKARIGDGPNGETIVFGLTDEDKKKQTGIASIDIFDGKLEPAENFYGELHRDGRIYVFDRWEDFQAVRNFGHPAYMYSDIGAGPKGETIVFVLNSDNKSQKPQGLIAKFNGLRD